MKTSPPFFSKGTNDKHQIADILKINIGTLPMMYLGIPLSNNKLKTRDFGYLIDKKIKKISHWNSKMLNISVRIEFVKTVIHPVVQFWLQFTHFSMTVIQRINSICANFIWKSKVHKMFWDDVCNLK